MPAKTLMIQGTASSVGKSIIVTALCRIFRQDGLKVAPFKAQNMALNSFVTREGGEIGRSQAVQAEAAGIEPSVIMNPVLLKPEADSRCQVIVLGKATRNINAGDYYSHTPYLLGVISDSLERLRAAYDIVVIEGAGSPAEINLMEREIVNMRIARMADAPVLLVGDIDRGGVFASIFGTLELLNETDRSRVKGLLINKFRGDPAMLRPGLDMLEQKTSRPVLGIIPYFRNIKIAQEDSVFLDERQKDPASRGLDIAVIRLPHISNYDDFDPLEDTDCAVRYISEPAELGQPDLIILPGTKSTVADLNFLREQRLADGITRLVKAGTPVAGICGGYQMLGKKISDPFHIESPQSRSEGLGLLDMETIFAEVKTTVQIKARLAADGGLFEGMAGTEINGYEIHMGQTTGRNAPLLRVTETPAGKTDYFDGAISSDSLIFGSYVHGLFHNFAFTRALLNRLRLRSGLPVKSGTPLDREKQYDDLADLVRQNLDMRRLYRIIG
jgi:adenosylcobyric acid synthase